MVQPKQNRFLVESLIGGPNGVAGLGLDAKVPDAQLPPYSPLLVDGKAVMRAGDFFVNARDYGVVANGNLSTGAGTDNTAALTAAITAAKAANKILYIPSGTYRTTDMLDLRGCRTCGDGIGRTVIMNTDNTKAIVLLGGGAQYLADMTLQHFSKPDSATISVPNGVGIRLQKLADRSVIERIHIVNVTSGIYCKEPYNDTTNFVFSASFRDIRIDRFSHSIMCLLGSAAGNTGNVFTNIYAQNSNYDGTLGTSTYGWQLGTMADSQFNNINIEWGHYSVGFDIAESYNLFFNGIHFERYNPKGSTFSGYFNVYGAASNTISIRAVTLKDCTYDIANIGDYCLMRLQNGAKVFWDGMISTGATKIGNPTLRTFIFSPVDAGASIYARGFRSSDAAFQANSEFYQTTPTVSAMKIAAGSALSGVEIIDDKGAIRGRTGGGSTVTLAGEIVNTSANYAAKASDAVVLGNGGASGITITLPAAVKGASYKVKKIDAGVGAVTIATTSAQLIDGASTKALSAQYASVDVYSDGNAWHAF